MKVLCYIPLHYGKEYLHEAIKSVEKYVDTILILYTAVPSFGHGTALTCPDTREELMEVAKNASTKVQWMEVYAGNEGEHRKIALSYNEGAISAGNGYDLVFTIDADEVWEEMDLVLCLEYAYKSPCKYFGINGFINFYKSFNTVCKDSFTPIRIIKPAGEGTDIIKGTVYHFSLAQRDEVVNYKWTCHGHQNELRPNWLQEKYFGYKEGMNDLHPVAEGIWNPEPFDKSTLPEILKQHSNFNKEVIC